MTKSTKYLLVSFLTFVVGYIFLEVAYDKTSEIPFVQEIVLVVLGTIVTIAITAALLAKQSEVELEKEQNVKIFDIKSDLYFQLIDFLEELILKGTIDDNDLIKIEFLTHKISVIASSDVLEEYFNLLTTIKNSSKDNTINAEESDDWSVQIANLCTKIRYDLVPKTAVSSHADSLVIKKNNKIFIEN